MTADKNTRYCFVQLGRSKRNKRNKKRRKRQRIQAEKQRKSEEVKNNFKQVIDQLNELTRTNLLLLENFPKYKKLRQEKKRVRQLAFDITISPLTGLLGVINLISQSIELLNIGKETAKDMRQF